eukprot:1150963-Pelagomonas_calceolata.AAC.5
MEQAHGHSSWMASNLFRHDARCGHETGVRASLLDGQPFVPAHSQWGHGTGVRASLLKDWQFVSAWCGR